MIEEKEKIIDSAKEGIETLNEIFTLINNDEKIDNENIKLLEEQLKTIQKD